MKSGNGSCYDFSLCGYLDGIGTNQIKRALKQGYTSLEFNLHLCSKDLIDDDYEK